MFSISGIETRNQAKMTIIIIRLQAEILLRLSICWPKESDYITKVVLRTLPTTVQRQHNKHWLERINVTHATVIRYPEWTQLPSDQSFFNRIIRVLISRSQDDDQWWHWHGYMLVFIEFLEGRERFVGNKIREKCLLCYSFVMKRRVMSHLNIKQKDCITHKLFRYFHSETTIFRYCYCQ